MNTDFLRISIGSGTQATFWNDVDQYMERWRKYAEESWQEQQQNPSAGVSRLRKLKLERQAQVFWGATDTESISSRIRVLPSEIQVAGRDLMFWHNFSRWWRKKSMFHRLRLSCSLSGRKRLTSSWAIFQSVFRMVSLRFSGYQSAVTSVVFPAHAPCWAMALLSKTRFGRISFTESHRKSNQSLPLI